MGVKTRIGIVALSNNQMSPGSIELPKEITLYCPQCGEKCANKGQCLIRLVPFDEEKKLAVKLIVDDCRKCGCFGKAPIIKLSPTFKLEE